MPFRQGSASDMVRAVRTVPTAIPNRQSYDRTFQVGFCDERTTEKPPRASESAVRLGSMCTVKIYKFNMKIEQVLFIYLKFDTKKSVDHLRMCFMFQILIHLLLLGTIEISLSHPSICFSYLFALSVPS